MATACGVLLAAGAVIAAQAAAGDPPTPQAPAAEPTVVTLITGERVQVSRTAGKPLVTIDPKGPGPAAASSAFRTMTIDDHAYVVPQSALPLLGRKLDLSLFDVTHPVTLVEVTPSDGGAGQVPGLTPAGGPPTGSAGTPIIARVDSPAAFGAALTGPDPLPGVTRIAAAPAAAQPAPTAAPQYPMATLTVKGLDRNGAPAISGSVTVDNVDDLQRFASMQSFAASGAATFSVPVGNYSIAVEIATVAADGTISSDSVVLFPELAVTAPATVMEADARTATALVPLPKTPKPATVEQMTTTFGRSSANGMQASVSYLLTGSNPRLYVTPTKPVTLGDVHWYNYYRLNGPATGSTADSVPGYLYDLQFPHEGTVPATFDTTVGESDLAVVDAMYYSDVSDHRIGTYRASIEAWELVPMRFISSATAPVHRTEYVSGRSDVRWASGVVWNPAENNGVDLGPWIVLKAGESLSEPHLAAPLVPGADASATGTVPCPACRQGDTLLLNLATWSGRGGRTVSSLNPSSTLSVSTTARLFAGDNLLLEATAPSGTAKLPAARTPIRLELNATKSGAWTRTSTEVKTVWQWTSQARTGTVPSERVCQDGSRSCTFEPLLFLGYDAKVSQSNTIPADAATEVGIVAGHQLFDQEPAAVELTFEVSADDGKTWTPATVRAEGSGRFTATIQPTAGTGFLSFRVNASDSAGSSVAQTITRAVKITP